MWPIILEVAFKIVGYFIDKAKLSDEAKKNFFEWIKSVGNEIGSVKLLKFGDEQLKWLKEHPWQES